MADSDPAVQWWENDPRSPGNLERTDIQHWRLDAVYPELTHAIAVGYFSPDCGDYARPMFEVLPQ